MMEQSDSFYLQNGLFDEDITYKFEEFKRCPLSNSSVFMDDEVEDLD